MNVRPARRVVLIGICIVMDFLRPGPALAEDLPQGKAMSGDPVIPSGFSSRKSGRDRLLPGDQTIQTYDVEDPQLKAAIEKSRQALTASAPVSQEPPMTQKPVEEVKPLVDPSSTPAPKAAVVRRQRGPRKTFVSGLPVVDDVARDNFADLPSGVRIFSQGLSLAKVSRRETFVLPATSIALATTLYGIEATTNEERLVPAELNYAWLGPNGAVVEMKNCRLWVRVKGDYSTERIYGRSESISCRAPTGETFDLPMEAHMVDQEEEYLGARGTLVARGKALASALSFLSDGVKAFGSAMSAAQVNTEVAQGGGLGEPIKGSNVGGDKNRYIAGQTIAGSSAKFLDWWIDYYQSLSPTIAIGPGKKIYLALHRTIEIPKVFFGERVDGQQTAVVSKALHGALDSGGSSQFKVNTNRSISATVKRAEKATDQEEGNP